MRRLLLATTAIAALALGMPLGLAQTEPNGPGGAIQEQPQGPSRGGKTVTPAPGPTAPGKSTQTPTPAAPNRLNSQTEPQTPGAKQPQHQPIQGQSQPQAPSGQQRVQGQTQPAQPRVGQVQVTVQQRTQIHERLAHFRAARIEHPQFSISVGVVIPRTIHVEVLPPEIVEIVPEYSGFAYVMVGDEILIVDPVSLQIVAVIPA